LEREKARKAVIIREPGIGADVGVPCARFQGFQIVWEALPVPYVDGSLLQGLNGKFDRIACFHMSGLSVRSHVTAGQDGFRGVCSQQGSGL